MRVLETLHSSIIDQKKAAAGLFAAAVLLPGCGDSKDFISNPNECSTGPGLELITSQEAPTDKSFCIEQVFPMGMTEVREGDEGELALIGLRIRVADRLYACVVPSANPVNDRGAGKIKVASFSLRNSCFELPDSSTPNP